MSQEKQSRLKNSPILTVAAELDGLTRISRIAESFYHEILSKEDQNNIRATQPFAVIEGMNHMQFAAGHKPILVRKRDLKAEISNKDAHKKVALHIANFIESRISPTAKNKKSLTKTTNKAESLLKPMIKSMELEGSYHLKKPCAHSSLTKGEDCWLGSPWALMAQHWFVGSASSKINATNEFHEVWRIFPFFHPEIDTNCQTADKTCKLKLKSIAQATYELISKFDSGFNSNSASEIRIKFKSRQAILRALGEEDPLFEETDSGSWCQKLNQKAIDWAEANASNKALSRYKKTGIIMKVGEDFKKFPDWPYLDLAITFSKTQLDQDGNSSLS